MAAERSQALQHQEGAQLTRDQLELQRAGLQDRSILDRAGLDLDQRKYQATVPGTRMTNSVRGSMLANAHPITVGQGPSMTLSSGRTINPIHFGGYDASLLNKNTRDLGDAVTGQALQSQLAGDKFDPLEKVDFPKPQGMPQASGMDRAIGTGAQIAGAAGTYGPILAKILARSRGGQ